jgi:hypothetical protein
VGGREGYLFDTGIVEEHLLQSRDHEVDPLVKGPVLDPLRMLKTTPTCPAGTTTKLLARRKSKTPSPRRGGARRLLGVKRMPNPRRIKTRLTRFSMKKVYLRVLP